SGEKGAGIREVMMIADHYLDAQGLRSSSHDFDRLRMTLFGDEHLFPRFAPFERIGPRDRFRRSGAFIQKRGIGDFHPGQINDHCLKIEERFEPALGDFRLIWRVLSVPAGIFQNVPLDDWRSDAIGITGPDKGAKYAVLSGNDL